MRTVGLFALVLLAACAPDLSTICPHKTSITQGVFGGIVDSNDTQEQNVEVDLYTIENGVQSTTATFTVETTRGGYELNVSPSTYILCAKTVCATVTVPTGLVELSAVDAASGLPGTRRWRSRRRRWSAPAPTATETRSGLRFME